jgi:hypothetical protein
MINYPSNKPNSLLPFGIVSRIPDQCPHQEDINMNGEERYVDIVID